MLNLRGYRLLDSKITAVCFNVGLLFRFVIPKTTTDKDNAFHCRIQDSKAEHLCSMCNIKRSKFLFYLIILVFFYI